MKIRNLKELESYLSEIAEIDTQIENKQYEYTYWYEKAKGTSGGPEGERVQSSGSKKLMEEATVRYVDIEKEIESLVHKRDKFVSLIEKLKKIEYDFLHKIYIQHFTLKQLQYLYGKSYTWATTRHSRAKRNLLLIIKGE